jgi:hypothetical protein
MLVHFASQCGKFSFGRFRWVKAKSDNAGAFRADVIQVTSVMNNPRPLLPAETPGVISVTYRIFPMPQRHGSQKEVRMRVPDLDWPTDLFDDATSSLLQTVRQDSRVHPTEAAGPFWPSMLAAWTRDMFRPCLQQ